MTLGNALLLIDEKQPNSESAGQKIQWLRQLDMEVFHEVIMTHEGSIPPLPAYDTTTELDRVLLVPEPYDSIYLHWLQSRIDYTLGDTERYNNSNAQFEADRTAYRAWYNRTHMPIGARGRYW